MADDEVTLRRKRIRELTRLRVKRFRENKKDKALIDEVENTESFFVQPSTSTEFGDANEVIAIPYNKIPKIDEIGIEITNENLVDIAQNISAIPHEEHYEASDHD